MHTLMARLLALWPKAMPLLLPLAVVLVMLYTADQLLTGERGLVTWRVMREQVDGLQADITLLEADTQRLMARIQLLKAQDHAGSGRDDYEDELIRRELGLMKPGDRVMLLGAQVSPLL